MRTQDPVLPAAPACNCFASPASKIASPEAGLSHPSKSRAISGIRQQRPRERPLHSTRAWEPTRRRAAPRSFQQMPGADETVWPTYAKNQIDALAVAQVLYLS